MSGELAGVIPITATPFDERGRIDEASIPTIIDFEARYGVHGLRSSAWPRRRRPRR